MLLSVWKASVFLVVYRNMQTEKMETRMMSIPDADDAGAILLLFDRFRMTAHCLL